jgi:hypothetical protein
MKGRLGWILGWQRVSGFARTIPIATRLPTQPPLQSWPYGVFAKESGGLGDESRKSTYVHRG